MPPAVASSLYFSVRFCTENPLRHVLFFDVFVCPRDLKLRLRRQLMEYRQIKLRVHPSCPSFRGVTFLALLNLLSLTSLSAQTTPSVSKVVGTVQAISGNSVTVLSDAGATSSVSVEDATKLLQIEPGKTDLKEAVPLALADLQPGDRILVRGLLADDGKTIRAASLIAMKKAAISEKQTKERAEWQRGVGGLVKSIDPATQIVVLITNGINTPKEVTVHLAQNAVLRRYAPDSTRFDAARPAPLSVVQVGDQLRARGNHGADAANFDAVEAVSGSFRNIAGTVSSVDSASNTVVVQDIALKAPVTLRVTAESQMRKLPPAFAERIAARLRGQGGDSTVPGAGQPGGQGGGQGARESASPGSAPQSGPGPGPGPGQSRTNGAGGPGAGGGAGDFQQMIARMPAATLPDLQKGDAVMVVATQDAGKDSVTVITLLDGVDAILRASPKGGQDMILSPWSLGGGEPSGN